MQSSDSDHMHWSGRRWWAVVACGCLTMICGSIGVWQAETAQAEPPAGRLADALYTATQMLLLQTPQVARKNWWLRSGEWLGTATLLLTTWALLWRRLRAEFRAIRASLWTGHTIICGLGRKGLQIARSLRHGQPNARIVAIDPHPDPVLAEEADAEGVHLILDDATDPHALAQARVEHAGEIITLTPSDETNVRIAAEVRVLREHASHPATCHVHLSGIHLRHSLQSWTEHHPPEHGRETTSLRFFDTYDDEARRVLMSLPLDGDGISASDPRSVHVVIIGQGRMGTSILLRAAKIGHFANGKPIRISVIDREAELRRAELFFRYPVLAGSEGICTLTYHQLQADAYTTRQLIEGWAAEGQTLLHLFVCMDDNAGALDVGLRLRDVLAAHSAADLRIRINKHDSLAPILENTRNGADDPRIDVFGMVEDCCGDGAFRRAVNERLARAIHGDFALARATDQPGRTGEPTLRPWEELDEDTRESNRQQADHIPIKMRAIGCAVVPAHDPRPAIERFEPEEIELLSRLEHTRWSADRRLAGYRYGPKKDPARRLHNCLVPWDELPDTVKPYDREAVANIPMWLSREDPPLKVVRGRS